MTVTIKNREPLVVPPAIRRRAGFRSGQELEFKASRGVITIVRKVPNADDEYTREQRLAIDAQLVEGLADIKAGRTYGPFDTADEMIAHMKAPLKKRAADKRAKRSR